MRRIEKAFSHLDLANKDSKPPNTVWKMSSKNEKILKSAPYRVKTYQELVELVAQIAYYNQNYILFFRGQEKDFKDNSDKSTVLPSIYRPENKGSIKERFDKLEDYSDTLVKMFQKQPNRFAGTSKIIKYEDLRWAILQHYGAVDTPVLDVTHSIHVASSFAIKKVKQGDYGVIQVLGLPSFTSTISYFTNEEISIIRLLAFAPPSATRLFMQESYSISPFPYSDLVRKLRTDRFDFARRLIAKFEIPNTTEFWGNGISIIDDEFLFPEKDAFAKFLTALSIDYDRFWEMVEKEKT